MMRWHGLSVLAGLFAAGVIAAGHVPGGWDLRRQRASGLTLIGAAAGAVATGYALAYLVPEGWRPGVGWLHSACGVVAFGLGAAHSRVRRAAGRAPLASARRAEGQT
jgi:hypothetical protein